MYSLPLKTNERIACWKDRQAFVRDNPQFSLSQLNYLVRQRRLNGLDQISAIRKVGRKLYIHEERFAQWLEDQSCHLLLNGQV